MKWLLIISVFFISCNGNGKLSSKLHDSEIVPTGKTGEKDTSVAGRPDQPVDGSNFIIPGERIGKLKLGDDVSSLDVLGPADESDAAMGKAWLTWKGKRDEHNNVTELKVYTTYKDNTMMQKTIQQIRTTSSSFHTPQSNHVYSSLNSIESEFKNLQQVASYKEAGREFTIYDEVSQGIAFEIVNANSQKICTGIIVHEKKKKVTDVYITLHPQMVLEK